MITTATLKTRLANLMDCDGMSLTEYSRALRIAKLVAKATGESVDQVLAAAA